MLNFLFVLHGSRFWGAESCFTLFIPVLKTHLGAAVLECGCRALRRVALLWDLARGPSCLHRGTGLVWGRPGDALGIPPEASRSCFFLSLGCCSTSFQHFLFQTKPKEYNPEQEVFITRDPSPVPAAGLCPRPRGLRAPSTAPSPRCREQTHQTGFQ